MKNVHIKSVKEEIAIEVMERLFAKKVNMRVVIAPHPVHGKPSPCVPYLDLAEALTCPSTTIHNIISRSKRIRKYTGILIMRTPGGLQPLLCIFEEGLLHCIMKLQPSRCQDPEVGNRLDELQDELVQILRDVLHGYYQRRDQTSSSNAKTLCQLIGTLNKTTDPDILQIIDGRKLMDKTESDYVINELSRMTPAETKERLRNDEEFNELYTEYLIEVSKENPEVMERVKKIVRKAFPEITFDGKEN